MEETPKARPDAPARDPFRQSRGSYDLFGKGGNGHADPPPTAPPPPPRAHDDPPPPPPPYQGPRRDDYDMGSPPPRGGPGVPDMSILFALIEAIRRMVPGDLEGQFNNLLREVLKTLRAMIDWYLERLDSPERQPEVEDIPID